MIGLTGAFVVALAVTTLTTPWVMRLAARCGAMAVPRDRDVHEAPTPRWGGMAIYAGAVVAIIAAVSYRHWRTDGANGWNLQLLGLLLGATFIAVVGVVDDLLDLRPVWQLAAIAAAGTILIAFGVRIEGVTNPLSGLHAGPTDTEPSRWVALPFPVSVGATLFWVLLVTKTVDAIDGLDGLAAGVCAISSVTLALLATTSHQPGGPAMGLVTAALAGACVGFLRLNFHPAKVFMSTVGAQFLGLMLAGASIVGPFKAAAAVSVLVPLLVLGVPIFDYGVVIVKRLRQGAPIMRADRRHFHHRLLDRGLTHRQAVYVIYAVTFTLCLIALLLFRYTRAGL